MHGDWKGKLCLRDERWLVKEPRKCKITRKRQQKSTIMGCCPQPILYFFPVQSWSRERETEREEGTKRKCRKVIWICACFLQKKPLSLSPLLHPWEQSSESWVNQWSRFSHFSLSIVQETPKLTMIYSINLVHQWPSDRLLMLKWESFPKFLQAVQGHRFSFCIEPIY